MACCASLVARFDHGIGILECMCTIMARITLEGSPIIKRFA